MAENSEISWTHHTFNAWMGCTKVSEACQFCYAESLTKRFGKAVWGPSAPRQMMSDAYWKQPAKWDRKAAQAGERHRVFCSSLADVFEGPETMPAESWALVEAARDHLWETIRATPNLDWLLLTKRPDNIEAMKPDDLAANVWLGTTIEKQKYIDRAGYLYGNSAAVRFLSLEPLLELVDLESECGHGIGCQPADFIDWVIVGGESGHHPRPLEAQWALDVREQCREHGIAFHFKQGSQANWPRFRDFNSFPDALQLREYPVPR